MGFSLGIVGLPNVGKSTLFNALSSAQVLAQNFPFCTIEPNVGVVPVPDPRLQQLSRVFGSEKTTPTSIRFVDIAGLVRGASRGEGLGNQFLAHIREVDAIAQVVRCFTDDSVTHVNGQVDPVADVEIIDTELCLKDLETVSSRLARAENQAKSGDAKEIAKVRELEKLLAHLDHGHPARYYELQDPKHADLVAELMLLTEKPVFLIANVSEDSLARLSSDPGFTRLMSFASQRGLSVVPICAAFEAQLAELPVSEQAEFRESVGLSESSLAQVIRTGYDLLGLITFFTGGPKECRARTVRRGATAPEAAGVIHSDFQRGFIRAEVIASKDLVECGSEARCRETGRLSIEGQSYVVRDGDVIHFRFNV